MPCMATSEAMERLTRGLVDDAAIFPPGLAPLPEAVRQHRAWGAAPVGSRLGPLLLSPAAVAELPAVLPATEPADRPPLPVAVVARPATSSQAVDEAVATLRGLGASVRLVGIECAAEDGWAEALRHGVDLAVELPRDPAALERSLSELAAAGGRGAPRVVAKWRTQAGPAGPIPTPEELAGFITRCVATGIPFKLTGGLHHAVAQTDSAQSGEGTEEMHGMLNVAVATERAVAGQSTAVVAAALRERDAGQVAADVAALAPEQVEAVRTAWVSFGCCGVTDPLSEAATLGVLSADVLNTTPEENP